MRLLEYYSNLKDKIEDDEIVKENFQNIFTKFKKLNTGNKEVIEELEKKFFAGEKMVVPKTGKAATGGVKKEKKKTGVKRTFSKMKLEKDEDAESVASDVGEPENNVPARTMRTRAARPKKMVLSDSEEDFDDLSD